MESRFLSKRAGQTQIISFVLITGILVGIIGTTYMWGVPMIEKSQSSTQIEEAESLMENLKDTIDEVAQTGDQRIITVNLAGNLEFSEEKNSLIYSIETKSLSIASTDWVPLTDGLPPISQEVYALKAASHTETININGKDCDIAVDCSVSSAGKINGGACFGDIYAGGSFNIDGNEYTLDHIDCANNLDNLAVIFGPETEVIGVLGADEQGSIVARTSIVYDNYITDYRLTYREVDDTSNYKGYKIKLVREGNNIANAGEAKISVTCDDKAAVTREGSELGGDLVETTVRIKIS